MNDYDVDLAVVGSGGAAMSAAIAARQAGAAVVLVERDILGGTCVNVGCVPSKMLLAAAGARYAAASSPFAGVPTSADGAVDLGALVAQKDELLAGMRQAKYADVAATHGFEVRPGEARFLDRDTMAVDSRPLRTRAYLVATGSEPDRPDLTGLDEVDHLTSATAMEQRELPESLVVIGGGCVGLELAQLFAHLGARVTVVGRLAPQAEPELGDVLRQVFDDDGITVLEEHATAVHSESGAVVVTTASGQSVRGQRLLVATGRRARTDNLHLGVGGVKTDARGFITIDEHQRTSNPRVFAAGDVSGAPQHVYVAAAGGRAAALNALAAGPAEAQATVDYTGLPAVIFTKPQLASVGLTEVEAVDRGYVCECRVLGFQDVPRALVDHDTRGVLKLVAEVGTGRVLGVHAAADGAGEIMLAATYAIETGMAVDQLADIWAPYLTMAESLRIAAGLFRNQMPTSCCA